MLPLLRTIVLLTEFPQRPDHRGIVVLGDVEAADSLALGWMISASDDLQ